MRTSATYPSEKQVQYATDLLDKKNLFAHPGFFDQVNAMDAEEYAAYIQQIKNGLPLVTRGRISEIIQSLRALPNAEARSADPRPLTHSERHNQWHVSYMPDPKTPEDMHLKIFFMKRGGANFVPRGSYAIKTDSLPGRRTNETNFYSVWISDDGERWTVRQYLSDERTRIVRAEQHRVLDAIAADPAAAASLYGHEIGKCGICGRKLTNDESRERGIGPVCAERWGW